MTVKEQADYAASHGYHPLGNVETEVDTAIDENEKILLAEEQSKRLMKAKELDADKKAYVKKKTGEMNSELGQAMVIAQIVSQGFRREVRQLACFLDAKSGLRRYYDPSYGTVKTEPMTDHDRQLRLV